METEKYYRGNTQENGETKCILGETGQEYLETIDCTTWGWWTIPAASAH